MASIESHANYWELKIANAEAAIANIKANGMFVNSDICFSGEYITRLSDLKDIIDIVKQNENKTGDGYDVRLEDIRIEIVDNEIVIQRRATDAEIEATINCTNESINHYKNELVRLKK